MGDSLSREQGTEKQYDRWLKKSLCNEQTEFFRELSRRMSKQTLFSELDVEQAEALEDSRASAALECINAEFLILQYSVEVQDTLLYAALSRINERARNIILMFHWLGMTDQEIAGETGLRRRTVNDIRNKTYAILKEILEADGYGTSSFLPSNAQ